MNYHQLPCGTTIPPEGLNAWVRDFENVPWVNGHIVAYTYCEYPVMVCPTDANGHGIEYRYYTLTDPNAKKKRLMTPMELAGKWVKHPGYNWEMVVMVNELGVFVGRKQLGIVMKKLKQDGYKWADHPSAEVHDSFEVDT